MKRQPLHQRSLNFFNKRADRKNSLCGHRYHMIRREGVACIAGLGEMTD